MRHYWLNGCQINDEQGFSEIEVEQVFEMVSGKTVPVKYGLRRLGELPREVADASKIRKDWGGRPSRLIWRRLFSMLGCGM